MSVCPAVAYITRTHTLCIFRLVANAAATLSLSYFNHLLRRNLFDLGRLIRPIRLTHHTSDRFVDRPQILHLPPSLPRPTPFCFFRNLLLLWLLCNRHVLTVMNFTTIPSSAGNHGLSIFMSGAIFALMQSLAHHQPASYLYKKKCIIMMVCKLDGSV